MANELNKKAALPTQLFIEVDEIKNGVVVLKNGGLRKLIMVSGVNFDLKSENEQEMIIGAFQGFLNSINFSIQIFIHSRKLNIESYLDNLGTREAQESNDLLKNLISEYREFIRAFVSENAIMNKTYFVVVPYDPIKLGESGEVISSKLFGILKKKGVQKPTERIADKNQTKEQRFGHNLEQLEQRVNQVVSGLNQVELRAVPLNDDEIIELLYNLYNPEAIEKQGIELNRE